MRARLIASVHSRVTRYVAGADAGAVLDPAALDELAALLQTLGGLDGCDDPVALLTAGRLRWCRHLALGSDRGDADRDAALALFARLPEGWGDIPAAARDMLRAARANTAGTGAGANTARANTAGAGAGSDDGAPEATYQRALDLIGRFEREQDRASLDLAVRLLAPYGPGPAGTGGPGRAATLALLGHALRIRYSDRGDRGDLSQALWAGRMAVAATPHRDPMLPSNLSELVDAELLSYEITGEPDRLRAAGTAAERLRAVVPPTDPTDAIATALLAHVRCQQFEHHGDPAVLVEAVELARRCPPDRFADPAEAAVPLSAMAALLWRSFEHHGDRSDLRLAVSYARAARQADPGNTLDRAHVAVNISAVLIASYEHTSAPAELDEAIDAGRAGLAAVPETSRFGPVLLGNLCRALLLRFRHGGDEAALREAVDVGRRALAATPGSHRGRLACLINLSTALTAWCDATGERAALDEATSLTEQALSAAPPGHPEYFKVLANHSGLIRLAGGRLSQPATVLDRAVDSARAAVAAAPPGHHNRATALAALAMGLRAQYVRTGNGAALREAVELARESVRLTTRTDLARRTLLMLMADVLASYARRFGDPRTLREAVAAGREALRTGEAGAGELGADLSSVAELLTDLARDTSEAGQTTRAGQTERDKQSTRAGQTDEAEALFREAEALARRAVALSPPRGPSRAARLGTLSSVLAYRYVRTGTVGFIRESVELARQALAVLPPDTPDRASYLHSLGMRLALLHRVTNQPEVLAEAVQLARLAARALPDDHPYLARSLSAISDMLGVQYGAAGPQGEPATRATTVALLRRALAATAEDDPAYGNLLDKLSMALRFQHEQGAAPATLSEAIARARQALALDNENRAERFTTLGNALLRSHLQDRAKAVLDEAVEALRTALRLTDHDGDRAIGQFNLGLALRCRAEYTDNRRTARSALKLFQQAARAPAARPWLRARAAAQYGSLAAAIADWPAAARGCERAVESLTEVAPAHLRRAHRADQLLGFAGLAANAAAAMLYHGDPRRAVELLEQGRGVLLGQALDLHTGLAELRRLDPRLAQRFAWLRDERDLGEPSAAVAAAAGPVGPVGPVGQRDLPEPLVLRSRAAQRRHELAGEWHDLVARIRDRPGFARFLAPPSCADLLAHAADGPIVVLNISPYRSDALALTPDGLRVIHLPDATPDAVLRTVDGFLAAVAEANAPGGNPESADAALDAVLRWLWDAVAGPVLDTLGFRDRPALGAPWPRLWWAPTGLVSLLPLHAAGYHAERGSPQPPTVLDRVVSSYTPTVRALAHARRRLAASTGDGPAPGGPPALLVVSMPETPELPDGELPGAAAEADVLAELFPGATVLRGPHARREAVVAGLRDHPWVHFACHSRTDPLGLTDGDLMLYDHASRAFTVADIARLDLPSARFAFLSACDTARADLRLPDEAVHISSAFLLAGFGSVVGTLWSIDDDTSVQITRSVYTALAAGSAGHSGQAAVALHRATLRARSGQPDSPSLWAAHVHVGA